MRYVQEKTIDKIKKLLALASSPNEHEAQSALLKAQELLAKHNLTINDVDSSEAEESVIQHRVDISFTKMEWRLNLANIIADNFRCYCWGHLGNRGKGIGFTFLGKESDVEICKTIYIYAKKFIENNVRRLQREYNAKGYSSKGVAQSYGHGFCIGLRAQFSTQMKAHEEEWGIVLSKPKDVVEKYEEMSTSFKTRSKQLSVNESCYNRGVKDGAEFSPNALTGTAGKQQSQLLLT